jgi:hypothetical protein
MPASPDCIDEFDEQESWIHRLQPPVETAIECLEDANVRYLLRMTFTSPAKRLVLVAFDVLNACLSSHVLLSRELLLCWISVLSSHPIDSDKMFRSPVSRT